MCLSVFDLRLIEGWGRKVGWRVFHQWIDAALLDKRAKNTVHVINDEKAVIEISRYLLDAS